ncbi:hypothetical protein GYMLUDRAFT_33643 [Collybiopsis luxurians FD-317 M1]|nr:hypothetical protein GYMLUDRAFT_33643 [Collybiopsis luxurians FD-317 M1]
MQVIEIPREIPHFILGSLEGAEIARIVTIACLALLVYKWLITLDQEIEYFWTGKWTLSRILFFLNRYVPPLVTLFGLILFSALNPSRQVCTSGIQFVFFADMITLGIVQAMLISRVWYLFPHDKIIQYGIIVLWIFSMAFSLAYTGVAAKGLNLLLDDSIFALGTVGCRAARPANFWRMFIPGLVLHTILYVLTAYRALRNRRVLQEAPVLKRLLRDGGLFFFVVFVSVGFTAVGSFLQEVPQINIPVIFSSYLITVTSIAMTRILFSIHSLASHLGSEAGWLLSNAELRRVHWRTGSTEGEIIIERLYNDDDDDPEARDGTFRSASALKMSKVGMFNDDTMWSQ